MGDLREKVARAIYQATVEHYDFCLPHWGDLCDEDRRVRLKQADAAIAAIPTGVKVKPLIWKVIDDYESAQLPWGHSVSVFKDFDGFVAVVFDEQGEGVKDIGGVFPSVMDAKAAAQADYESRILSVLQPAPMSVAEAAQVLIPLLERQHHNWAISKGRNPEDYSSAPLSAANHLRVLASPEGVDG